MVSFEKILRQNLIKIYSKTHKVALFYIKNSRRSMPPKPPSKGEMVRLLPLLLPPPPPCQILAMRLLSDHQTYMYMFLESIHLLAVL